MKTIRLKEDKLQELEDYGWRYDIVEGGYISPNMSAIAIDNRFPYNNLLLKFSTDEIKFKETVEWLTKNDFIKEEI